MIASLISFVMVDNNYVMYYIRSCVKNFKTLLVIIIVLYNNFDLNNINGHWYKYNTNE